MASQVLIRTASRADNPALTTLARLAGEPRPSKPCMVAEVDGRIQAALSLRGGPVLTDPECLGTGVAGLLRLRADEEVRRRQSAEQRARSRRLRATFARMSS